MMYDFIYSLLPNKIYCTRDGRPYMDFNKDKGRYINGGTHELTWYSIKYFPVIEGLSKYKISVLIQIIYSLFYLYRRGWKFCKSRGKQ